MRVPAICDNCGTIFPSGFEFQDSLDVSFSGARSDPCPNCGGNGHIPDGIYNFIGETIQLLSGPPRTVSELQRLADILGEARKEKATSQEVADKINKDLPKLSSIINFLPKSRPELYAFISIILVIIGLILGELRKDRTPKIEVNQVVNFIYQEQTKGSANLPAKPTFENRKQKKIGRNEPCPCGSGKKYKKCCLLKESH